MSDPKDELGRIVRDGVEYLDWEIVRVMCLRLHGTETLKAWDKRYAGRVWAEDGHVYPGALVPCETGQVTP